MPALRYVVLHHTGIDQPHYDLMFEREGRDKLASARGSTWPPMDQTILERIPDHRKAYLDYEGPVSENRGAVKRVESGTCTIKVDREDSSLLTLSTGRSVRVPRSPWD
jgi:hypothetical protein